MKLYFKNSQGVRREIAEVETKDAAIKKIKEFCDDKGFKIYYSRMWEVDNETKIDVGSHNEFFYLDCKVM